MDWKAFVDENLGKQVVKCGLLLEEIKKMEDSVFRGIRVDFAKKLTAIEMSSVIKFVTDKKKQRNNDLVDGMVHVFKLFNHMAAMCKEMSVAWELNREQQDEFFGILEGETAAPSECEGRLKDIDGFLEEVDEKLKNWKDGLISEIRADVKNEIKEILPTVVSESVKDISKNSKFTKPWSDLFKKSQDELKEEARRGFESTLKEQFIENQQTIIERVQAAEDVLEYEKQRRSRNVVIRNIPESTDSDPKVRKEHDLGYVTQIFGKIKPTKILKCFRAGAKSNNDDDQDLQKNRLVIVSLESPEEARQMHKFGMGNRVALGSHEFWVNPDLTQHERNANFKAREFKRQRMMLDESRRK